MQFSSILLHSAIPKPMTVEINSYFQIPYFHIIGLAGAEIQESKERIYSTFQKSGIEFPKRRVVVHLTPSDTAKKTTGYDLSIALSIYFSQCEKKPTPLKVLSFCSLNFEGDLITPGYLLRTLICFLESEDEYLILPKKEKPHFEKMIQSIPFQCSQNTKKILYAENFLECIEKLRDDQFDVNFIHSPQNVKSKNPQLELYFHSQSLQASLYALAGKHHLLLLGPKGSGKSTTLKNIVKLNPSTNPSLETLLHLELLDPKIFQNDCDPELLNFRWVDPWCKPASLLGSVHTYGFTPGEFSLSHDGFLIADEFPEMSRDSKELFRIPLEDKKIRLRRRNFFAEIPTNFQFLATGNTCPCAKSDCHCSDPEKLKYQKKISGPILDRIDMIFHQNYPSSSVKITSQEISEFQEKILKIQKEFNHLYSNPPGNWSLEQTEAELSHYPWIHDFFGDRKDFSARRKQKAFRLSVTIAAWKKKQLDFSILQEALYYQQSFCDM